MPNYYIQATRGHFNPLSFDELVKPLNMYKEYYDENEKAITEMRSQADLWNEIMKSEGNTDLANKYNQYSQNLNDAAQQLANGMSYNLRKQIQDLRAQSSMVKQIENAYTLRAKDIDTYNELMMKDPSRIGAFDPSRRSLNDYMQGPVTNEYGVSGDELYKKASQIGAAFSARHREKIKGQEVAPGLYQTIEKAGYNNEDITRKLSDPNSDLNKEIDKMLSDINVPLSKNAMQQARQSIIQGMVSGIKYDQDISYNRYTVPRGEETVTKEGFTIDENNNITKGFDPTDWDTEYLSSSGFKILSGKRGSTKDHTGEKIVELKDGSKKMLSREDDLYFDGNTYYVTSKDESNKILYDDISKEEKDFYEKLGVDFNENGLKKFKSIRSKLVNGKEESYKIGDKNASRGYDALPSDPSTQSFKEPYKKDGWGKEPLDPKYLTYAEFNGKYFVIISGVDNGTVHKVDEKTYNIYKAYKDSDGETTSVNTNKSANTESVQQKDTINNNKPAWDSLRR